MKVNKQLKKKSLDFYSNFLFVFIGTRPDVIPVIHIKDVWSSNQSSENVNLDQESPNTPKTETGTLFRNKMFVLEKMFQGFKIFHIPIMKLIIKYLHT